MATALSQPTGSQIIQLFPVEPGTQRRLGQLSAEAIDAHITNEGIANLVTREFNDMSTILTNAGYTPAALDDATEYPFAWNALRYACAYMLLLTDYESYAMTAGLKNMDTINSIYNQKLKMIKNKVAGNLIRLNITNSKWLIDQLYEWDFDIVDNCLDL